MLNNIYNRCLLFYILLMMKGKLNTTDFIDYISKVMDREDVILIYKINNITPERSSLYLDFSHSLFDLVTSTYLGDEVMVGKAIGEHFNWCWKNTINSFKKENINFDNISLYTYFLTLFLESFYSEQDKSENNINKLLDFWKDIFVYSINKTKSELDIFIDLYKIFDKSLSN
jgi:hypothetical protein